MKKLNGIIVMVGLLLIVLTACGGKSPENAGQVLMESLLHNKQTDKLLDTFAEGEEIKEGIKTINDRFVDQFVQGFTAASGSSTSDGEIKELGKVWKEKIEKETVYKVKKVETDKKLVTITYEITGFDLLDSYKKMMDNVFKKVKADISIASDQTKLQELVLKELLATIKSGKMSDKPIEAKLKMMDDGSKYSVASSNQLFLSEASVISFTGQKDMTILGQEVQKVNEELAKEMTELISQ